MYKVKICGITNRDDAILISKVGTDYLGIVVEVDFSKRSQRLECATDIMRYATIPVVFVVFNKPLNWLVHASEVAHPHAFQLHGTENATYVKELKDLLTCQIWKTLHISNDDTKKFDIVTLKQHVKHYIDAGVDTLLFDTYDKKTGKYGGTGKVANWEIIREVAQDITIPFFLAGGINHLNVNAALDDVKPHGIDISSGVEAQVGNKDPEKVKNLIEMVKHKVRP